jgi:uncharacterized protein (DUF433 family)
MYSLESSKLLMRITINPDVMVGKPVIRGMRITVEQILKALGSGVSTTDILADYPELEPQDIQAAILYASDRIENEKVYIVNG